MRALTLTYLSRTRLVPIMAIVLMLFGMVAGTALATDPAPPKPVNACYNATSGILRFIGDGSCRPDETALSWPSTADYDALNQTLAAADAAQVARIGTLEGNVSTLQGDVGTLKGQVATLQSQVTALQNEDTALAGRVGTLETKVADPVSGLQALLGGLSGLGGQLSLLAGELDGTQADLGTTNTRLTTLQTRTQAILTFVKQLMRGEFDAAWETLLDLWESFFGAEARDVLERAGNVLSAIFANTTERLAQIGSMLETLAGNIGEQWCEWFPWWPGCTPAPAQ